MRFDGSVDAHSSCDTVNVQYKDRVWEMDLRSNEHIRRDTSSIAFEMQAALNLASPPVGLQLRVASGMEAIVCPLGVLTACSSYMATTFQGMYWIPLLERGAGHGSVECRDSMCAADPLYPPPLGSPLEQDMSSLAGRESTMSPSEGCGRPLTAPPGDRARGITRLRPGRREGRGRPMSATPSDKCFGMRRFRPGKSEGFGRPKSAQPSDHGGSDSSAWGMRSPPGFRCDESTETIRPATAPAFAVTGGRKDFFASISCSGDTSQTHKCGIANSVWQGEGQRSKAEPKGGAQLAPRGQDDTADAADSSSMEWAWRRSESAEACWT